MKSLALPTSLLSTIQSMIETPLVRGLLTLPPAARLLLNGRAVRRDGLVLDPDMQTVLRLDQLVREPDLPTLPLAEARAAMTRQARIVGGDQPVGDVVDRDVPGPGGRIPLRVYSPRGVAADEVTAGLVFFHGGAWVYGGLDSHDALCRFLCEQAGVRVVAVDYRLAPEHVFPAAVEDGLAAYDWVREHTAKLGLDPGRIAVGGDSAGGTLATVVAAARQGGGVAPALQLLIYPSTRAKARTDSMRLFNEGFYLTQAMMDFGAETYVSDPADLDDPRVSPLLAEDLSEMCPAYVVTAGFDPLRDEGEAYAARLAEAGVEVELRRFDGLIHGFANMVGVGRSGPAAMREVARTLHRHLTVGSFGG
jgi:acetyl esterase